MTTTITATITVATTTERAVRLSPTRASQRPAQAAKILTVGVSTSMVFAIVASIGSSVRAQERREAATAASEQQLADAAAVAAATQAAVPTTTTISTTTANTTAAPSATVVGSVPVVAAPQIIALSVPPTPAVAKAAPRPNGSSGSSSGTTKSSG